MTEIGKSIRSRLLNIAKEENLSFQLIIMRYLQERLLFRLSLSRYSRNFCLKGGALLYSYSREKTRPTKDIDFLGSNIPNEIEALKSAFMEICSIEYLPDAVLFDPSSISAEEIAGQDEYQGIRLLVAAKLDTIMQRIQIDVGFGDIVIPPPVELSYPTFLPDTEPPLVRAYSLETVIAEKFEAMIDLSVANSRMKDFYDVYHILTTQHIDQDNLLQAIQGTFGNRETTYNEDHSLFTTEFVSDANRITQWKAFLSKNKLDDSLEFGEVVQIILGVLPRSI
jgi:predicted nucleotidyltransferase component of viral defense system